MTGITRRQLLAGIPATGLLIANPAFALDDFPSRPIRLVVCYVAGGSADALARQISVPLSEMLKRQVIVDNRPGGASAVAMQYVAQQPADGYTLVITDPSQLVLNPLTYKKLGYDPAAFEPVALLQTFSWMLLVNPNDPSKTLSEFAAAAKARPKGISYGSASTGSPAHLGMEKVAEVLGIKAVHIPYKGAAAALTDLMGGQIDAYLCDLPSGMQYVTSGRLRALAVTSPSRNPQLAGVPTFLESGYGRVDVDAWHGMTVKRGTPPAIVQKLNGALVAALADPRVSGWIRSQSATPAPPPNLPQDFQRVMKEDSQSWGKLISALGISLE
ncbi:tripartite tricarboxylate transporter substrate binding protein [Variovorax paradoxus]|nr:tripartite tricarboxylate transporter substrate binding protein [Variovorax paradoxus]MBT2305449.1 tripartite tricarboxylate transporter substrate binding protein [Variovorax paradoxus]